jgi:hypothetical protein
MVSMVAGEGEQRLLCLRAGFDGERAQSRDRLRTRSVVVEAIVRMLGWRGVTSTGEAQIGVWLRIGLVGLRGCQAPYRGCDNR